MDDGKEEAGGGQASASEGKGGSLHDVRLSYGPGHMLVDAAHWFLPISRVSISSGVAAWPAFTSRMVS